MSESRTYFRIQEGFYARDLNRWYWRNHPTDICKTHEEAAMRIRVIIEALYPKFKKAEVLEKLEAAGSETHTEPMADAFRILEVSEKQCDVFEVRHKEGPDGKGR